MKNFETVSGYVCTLKNESVREQIKNRVMTVPEGTYCFLHQNSTSSAWSDEESHPTVQLSVYTPWFLTVILLHV